MSTKHYARVKDVPHAAAREALQTYKENQEKQLGVLRNLQSLPPGAVTIHSSEVRLTAAPCEVYEDDGNTRCPGTKYDYAFIYGLCGQDAPDWHSYYRGEARCCLVFHADLEVRDRDGKLLWHGYSASYAGKYRGDKPLVRWHYSPHGMDSTPGVDGYLAAAAVIREVWADHQVARELAKLGVK